jgi:hypothetical protein
LPDSPDLGTTAEVTAGSCRQALRVSFTRLILALQLLQASPFVAGEPFPNPRIPPGLPDPLAQRLSRAADLRGY